jgi:hypothetical protein
MALVTTMHSGFFGKDSPGLLTQDPTAALEYELLHERVSALGRLGRNLEDALRGLAAFDAEYPRSAAIEPTDRRRRARLVARAARALWYLVIQREACGLRDMTSVAEMYRVPADVQMMMGAGDDPDADA